MDGRLMPFSRLDNVSPDLLRQRLRRTLCPLATFSMTRLRDRPFWSLKIHESQLSDPSTVALTRRHRYRSVIDKAIVLSKSMRFRSQRNKKKRTAGLTVDAAAEDAAHDQRRGAGAAVGNTGAGRRRRRRHEQQQTAQHGPLFFFFGFWVCFCFV